MSCPHLLHKSMKSEWRGMTPKAAAPLHPCSGVRLKKQTMTALRYDGLDDGNFHVPGTTLRLLLCISLPLLVFSVLLCLYLRWICHRGGAGTHPVNALTASAASGLDERTINSFPVRLSLAGEEAAQCSICLSGVPAGEKVKALPGCGHGFHVECVDEWLRVHASCPLCRATPRCSPAGLAMQNQERH